MTVWIKANRLHGGDPLHTRIQVRGDASWRWLTTSQQGVAVPHVSKWSPPGTFMRLRESLLSLGWVIESSDPAEGIETSL